MNTRVLASALMGAFILGAPLLATAAEAAPSFDRDTMAAMMTVPEKCNRLEKQFDMAVKAHQKAERVGEAKALRIEGGNLCANGSHAQGISKLERALRNLGVKPRV